MLGNAPPVNIARILLGLVGCQAVAKLEKPIKPRRVGWRRSWFIETGGTTGGNGWASLGFVVCSVTGRYLL